MKVYKLEFSFFDGSMWEQRTIEITAINKFQLIRGFLNETLCFHSSHPSLNRKVLWETNKQYIIEDVLTFPIISEK